jgi:hypothetical protein
MEQYVFPVTLLVLGIIILVFVVLVAWQAYLVRIGKHPLLQKVLDEAIVLAYKTSDAVFDVIEQRLHGAYKRDVVAALYTILPDYKILGRSWKLWITKDQFVDWVEKRFQELTARFAMVKSAVLQEMLEKTLIR